MTTEQDINKMIQEKYDKYRNSIYDGSVPFPVEALRLFKKAMMVVPWEGHQYNMVRVKEICDIESVAAITWLEAGMIMNFLNKVPPKEIFGSFSHYAEFMIAASDFHIEYNKVTEKWQREIEGYKNRLMNTSGIIKKSDKMQSAGGRLLGVK